MQFHVHGIPQQFADEVRRTRLSPGYGHPAHLELARGPGPCRCCLRQFVPGKDQRLLFTYRPTAGQSLHAPGPVFIHAEHCEAWSGAGFPPGLRGLPLAIEARTAGSRVTALTTDVEQLPEARIDALFDDGAEWLHLRHAEAGCFIGVVVVSGGESRDNSA